MSPDQTLNPGELQAALSNAMVRIIREFYGKGAARARTFLFGNYVFTILEGVLTTAEGTLRDGGEAELVREVRLAFEDLMTATFVGEVERLTARTVVAYHSQVLVEADRCAEIFVLDPTQDGVGASTEVDQPVEAADLVEPGAMGDVDKLPSPGEKPAPAQRDGPLSTSPAGTGPVRAALSNAVVKLVTDAYGKGPARTRTFIGDDHVLCALEGVLTTVESTLITGGQADLVRRLRTRFHQLVAPTFATEVQRIVGREVIACESQIVFDPDTLFLIFALGEDRATKPPATAGEVSSTAEDDAGEAP